MKASNLDVLWDSSPKLIMSTEMLFFFIFLARRTRFGDVSSIGEAIKTMIRCFCSLFCRCLRANYTHHYPNFKRGRTNYLSYLYSRCEVWGSRNFDTVHSGKNFTQVFCHCDFHLGPVL